METYPVLLRLPLRPLAWRQAGVMEIFLPVVLEPNFKNVVSAFFRAHRTAELTIVEGLTPIPLLRHPRAPRELLDGEEGEYTLRNVGREDAERVLCGAFQRRERLKRTGTRNGAAGGGVGARGGALGWAGPPRAPREGHLREEISRIRVTL